jgi:hypothetical protein
MESGRKRACRRVGDEEERWKMKSVILLLVPQEVS